MNCPNCGNEIQENQKFCTNCGTNISNIQRIKEIKSKIKNVAKSKPFIISLVTFVILFIASISTFAVINYNNKVLQEIIKPVEQTVINNKTTTDLLNLAISQENAMAEVIEKSSTSKATKIFEIFYKNLSILVDKMTVDDLDVTLQDDGTYKLNPYTKLINYEVNDWTGIWINNAYLNNKYSKYLDQQWQEYLKLSAKDTMEDIFSSRLINPKELTEEIIAWQNFRQKYPAFTMINKVNETIKEEVSQILYNDYAFSYTDDGSMSKETRQGYEEFLKQADKNTQEYNIVKNCYEELKRNGFRASSEFYKILNEYNPNEYYQELSKVSNNNEEVENDKYENSIYEKSQVQEAYTFSDEIKTAIKNKDINTFAEMLSYPITIHTTYSNQALDIKNKVQFIELGEDRVFTDDFIKEVCKDDDLFISYRGFMMGNGPNLFFDFIDNKLKIYALNISR